MIAWAALGIWPLISFILFQRLTLPKAVAITVVGGYLLLPERIGLDLPMLPELNKNTISVVTALVLALFTLRSRDNTAHALPGLLPRNLIVLGLLLVLTVGIVGSIRGNPDELVFGPRVLQGMRPYDGLSLMLGMIMTLCAYFLGRKVFATREAQRALLVVLVISALFYTLPALWEMRMSPQLHSQIYGFSPSAFIQQMRENGFRPMVFVGHGLSLSFFLASAVLAAAILFRTEPAKDRTFWFTSMVWLLAILVLCKSLGALLITLVLLPVLLFFPTRLQLLSAACIAICVLIYPFLRTNNLVPVEGVVAFAERIDERRAGSLLVRLSNEEILMARALERPVFGWGTWGRPRIYDPKTGVDVSITDGAWVIELGIGGWFRYIGIFGLLCYPVIALSLYRRDKLDPIAIALVVIVCAKLVDLLPNSEIGTVYWLTAGALLGRLELRAADAEEQEEQVQEVLPSGAAHARKDGGAPRYARDFPPKTAGKRPSDVGRTPRDNDVYARGKPAQGYRR